RTIEEVARKAAEDGGEAAEGGGDDASAGTDGVEGAVTALEETGWLTTVAAVSPTGLLWLATAFPAPLRRPPSGLAALAGVVQATVAISPASSAPDASALKECLALPSIAGIHRVLCAPPTTRIN